MSYLVLARKWRPQTFVDLVGQEHVAQTLKNAIAQGRIAHAFLFTGARGVGKTTIARVLAKALNCMSATGPTAEPCGTCAACEEIARGQDVDVKEIDGASNNSVEDIRRLQETLPYMPARDRSKVVIIDEVHMLSTGAFNALLKTLEEPPPHVKFIFATTEVHKVPITILSRCQRYDFKLIPTQKIRERIEYILSQENVAFDDAAVTLVAREAAGSMRDALSLLDQVIAGSTDKLTGTEASRLLGVADRAVLYDLARSILRGDAPAALAHLQSIAREGHDLATMSRDFLSLLRDLVVARIVPEASELLDLPDEEQRDVTAIAAMTDATDLERLFAAWSRAVDDASRAREPRWVLEMALVRLAHRPPLLPVEDLLARLVELEKRMGGSDPRPPGPSGGGGSGSGSGSGSGGSARTARPAAAPGTSGAMRHHESIGAPVAARVVTAAPSAVSAASTASTASTASAASAASAVSAPAAKSMQSVNSPSWLARAQALASDPRATPRPAVEEEPARTSVRPVAANSNAPSIDVSAAEGLLDAWLAIVEAADNGPVAVLRSAVPLELGAERVRVAFEHGSFYARKAQATDAQSVIALAAERIYGARPDVEIVLGTLPEEPPTLTLREERARAARRAEREVEAREHPLVKSFLEHVGGEVRSVKLDERN